MPNAVVVGALFSTATRPPRTRTILILVSGIAADAWGRSLGFEQRLLQPFTVRRGYLHAHRSGRVGNSASPYSHTGTLLVCAVPTHVLFSMSAQMPTFAKLRGYAVGRASTAHFRAPKGYVKHWKAMNQ